MNRPFPTPWEAILRKNIPLYKGLPDELKEKLHRSIQLFLAKKSFEGCGGLEVTEEMTVTIAGQACMLIMNQNSDIYPALRTILLYPSSFRNNTDGCLFNYQDDNPTRLGESWSTGSVILAWDSVIGDALNAQDGQNVVFHEFAHQLDQLDGDTDGAPTLENRASYASWARVLGEEYENLQDRLERGAKADLMRMAQQILRSSLPSLQRAFLRNQKK
ncbi:MAG: M90 family metallopeptidase [Verrucomicrobiota bacterium]